MQSTIVSIEAETAKIQQRRRDMLQICKLEQIQIPLKKRRGARSSRRRGRPRSPSVGSEADESSSREDLAQLQSQSQSQSQLDVQDVEIIGTDEIDFSGLRYERNITTAEEYNALKSQLEDELERLSAQIDALAPNLKSFGKFDEVKGEPNHFKDAQAGF